MPTEQQAPLGSPPNFFAKKADIGMRSKFKTTFTRFFGETPDKRGIRELNSHLWANPTRSFQDARADPLSQLQKLCMSRVAGFFSPIEFLSFKLSWPVQANSCSFGGNIESTTALTSEAHHLFVRSFLKTERFRLDSLCLHLMG